MARKTGNRARRARSALEEFLALPDDEKERVFSAFDQEFVAEKARPLTAAEGREEARARRRGRPRVGNGSTPVSVTVERSLLQQADALARRRRVSRSQLIAAALRSELDRDTTRDAQPGTNAKRRRRIKAKSST